MSALGTGTRETGAALLAIPIYKHIALVAGRGSNSCHKSRQAAQTATLCHFFDLLFNLAKKFITMRLQVFGSIPNICKAPAFENRIH
mmetsp:Transcript_9228/g.24826  ORF Transcript_9228/g.24826 Transcript_9228/m.24826 type:complete len:87 (-) Transcript_9228:2188-2448(-)